MKFRTNTLLAYVLGFLALAVPAMAVAYSQPYYQPYYQGYYQTYYQPYYQGYYQSLYQGSYAGAGSNTVYLTSGTSWTVPTDWVSGANTIEVIGGGGGGQSGTGFAGGRGGGGGGYSKISNLALTPGASITYKVGAGGAGGVGIGQPGENGGETYFRGTDCMTASVCARGGNGGNTEGGGALGTEGIGTVRYYGGTSPTPIDTKGTGGGGSAGPQGAGANAGGSAALTTGGRGGATYGGAGGVAGIAGSNGTEWSASYGSGGGGGGGSGTVDAVGGAGGTYGGGGGGGAGGTFSGGTGGAGIIVIQYTPTAAATPPVGGTTGDVDITVNTKITGSLFISGALSKGSGTFVIDHPLDPRNKLLYHSFVESPTASNLYDGIVTLGDNGEATITLPEYFQALNTDFKYQFAPIGAAMPGLYIKSEIKDNRFTIAGGKKGGKVSWQVSGVRHDPYIKKNPIITEVKKSDTTPVKKGECLFQPLCD